MDVLTYTHRQTNKMSDRVQIPLALVCLHIYVSFVHVYVCVSIYDGWGPAGMTQPCHIIQQCK